MSDMIFYKNGEETFRISPPTVGTKCPETKLEVKKMTEIEKTEGEIKVLQAKLELLKEMEKHKTPCENAYKRVYGFYPETYEDSWSAFQDGYIASQKDYKVEEEPKPEPKTLTDILYLWWSDVFTTHSDWDMETSIDDLVTRIEEWLPKPQSAAGSQNVYVECTVEGFNDCLNKIKGKLR